jgi:hypothetical protein
MRLTMTWEVAMALVHLFDEPVILNLASPELQCPSRRWEPGRTQNSVTLRPRPWFSYHMSGWATVLGHMSRPNHLYRSRRFEFMRKEDYSNLW